VFECIIDTAQFTALKLELSQLIDQEKDNLRFYRLGNNYKIKVEHMGDKPSLDLEDPLIFNG
jgi:CRISPR-associated protein Cas2